MIIVCRHRFLKESDTLLNWYYQFTKTKIFFGYFELKALLFEYKVRRNFIKKSGVPMSIPNFCVSLKVYVKKALSNLMPFNLGLLILVNICYGWGKLKL